MREEGEGWVTIKEPTTRNEGSTIVFELGYCLRNTQNISFLKNIIFYIFSLFISFLNGIHIIL